MAVVIFIDIEKNIEKKLYNILFCYIFIDQFYIFKFEILIVIL